MSYVTVPNRALLSVGTWAASTGEEVITEDDLAAILAAAQSGVLDAAVLKKGHQDPRFAPYNEDGEPAFGQVTNLRIEDGTLYGDYVKVPAELAESLESAYPHVSVELARNVKLRDTAGAVRHSFDCVLTAAALLGATAPAVKGLTTKAALLSEDTYDYTTMIAVADVEMAARRKAPAKAAAEQPAEDAPEPAAEPTPAPEQEPADTPDTPEPAPVDTPAPDAPDTGNDTVDVSPRTAQIAESSPETPSPRAASPEGARSMPNVDAQAAILRKKYGLPDSATYKDVLEKVLADDVVAGVQQNDKLDTKAGSDESPKHSEVLETIADETAARQKYNLSEDEQSAESVKVTAPAVELDNIYVSRSAFAEFQAEFEATKAELAARREAETKARRDDMVRSWFSAGLIHPTEVATIREQLDTAESTVVALTEARTPLPVHERGHAKADEAHFALGSDTKTEKLLELDDAIFGA